MIGAQREPDCPIVIVGAGPVGLTLGLGLARLGVRSVILDQDDKLSDGSRAICIQRHTLEIFGRLGAVEPMLAQGVTWTLGRIFWRQRELFQIRFPESDEQFPSWRLCPLCRCKPTSSVRKARHPRQTIASAFCGTASAPSPINTRLRAARSICFAPTDISRRVAFRFLCRN
jgi:hypothetical protein